MHPRTVVLFAWFISHHIFSLGTNQPQATTRQYFPLRTVTISHPSNEVCFRVRVRGNSRIWSFSFAKLRKIFN
jgi:hypothetical protein